MDSIDSITSAINFDMQRLNAVANNAANSLTPGFKRELVTMQNSFDTLLTGVAAGQASAVSSTIDFKPGIFQPTGNPFDLAIMNNGFFEVFTQEGLAYTRQGSFKVDDDGRLVTQLGQPVSGVSGDIYLTTSDPNITKEGEIFEAGEMVAKIKVVAFKDNAQLVKIGGGLFMPTADIEQDLEVMPRISQGGLESSNVNSTQEMVGLMETFRHFELSHKVIQAYDDIDDKVLSSLNQF